MAEEITPSVFRGLLVADSRFTLQALDADLSSYQEAGAEVARPTPDGASELQLSCGGTLTSDAAVDVRLTATKPGAAVGGDSGGRFVWRYGDDAVDERRGCLEPNKVTGWEHVAYDASVSTERPAAVTLADHTVIVVYSDTTNGALLSRTLDPASDNWGAAVTIDADVPGPGCLVALPRGRVICIYARDDWSAGGARLTLGLAFSDDKGATWTVQDSHLPGWSVAQADEDAVRQLRAVYHDGFISLVVETKVVAAQIRGYHLVSDDRGASWEQIETLDAGSATANDPKSWCWIPRPDGSLLGLYLYGDSGIKVGMVRKTSPRSVLRDEPSWDTDLAVSEPANLDGLLTACVFDDGLWLFAPENDTSAVDYKIMARRRDPDTLAATRTRWTASRDATGALTVQDLADLGGDSSEELRQLFVTPYKGGLILLHNPVSNGVVQNNIAALYLGGYSSLDWAAQTWGTHKATGGDVVGGMLFTGGHNPATIAAWTVSGAGTTAAAAGGREITTSANAYEVGRNGPTGASAGAPCLVLARVAVASGGSLSGDVVGLRLRRADGTDDYDVSIRLTDTAIRVYDNNAGAQVGSDLTGLTAGVTQDLLIGMAGLRVAVYRKLPKATLWELVASGVVTSDTGAPATGNRVEWGHLSTGTAVSTWGMVGSAINGCQEEHQIQDFAADDLQGRAFSGALQWLGEQEGYQLRAHGGSVARGDQWTCESRAQYGVENCLPTMEPSPAVDWRTTTAAATQILAWVLNDQAGTARATRLLSSTIGVYVSRCNVQTLYFEGRQVGTGDPGTWDTLLTIDQAAHYSTGTLTAEVDGDWVRPAAGTAAGGRYIEGGELIGGHLILTWTGGGGGSASYEILDNTEGVWRPPASSRALELRIDGDTSGISGTVTAQILPPAALGVAWGVTSEYDAYRLRIPGGQTVPDGEYRLGVVVVGPLLLFGRQYSSGRVVADEALIEEYEYGDGGLRRRDRNRPRRRADFAWTDPIDLSQLYGPSPDPDYLAGGSDGVALRSDGAVLAGLLRRTRAIQPVVYCPRIGPPETHDYAGPEYVYGWPSTVSTRTALLGDELEDELVTVDAISITEIL